MSKILEAQEELSQMWQSLQSQWEETRLNWNDEVGGLFEREFWNPLEESMQYMLRALDEAGEVLEKGLEQTTDV